MRGVSAAGASFHPRDSPGWAGQRALGGAGGCDPPGIPWCAVRRPPRPPRWLRAARARFASSLWLVGRSRGCLGVGPSAAVGSWTTCLLRPGAGEQGCAFSFGEQGGQRVVYPFLCFGKISAAPECYLNSFWCLVPSRGGEKLETSLRFRERYGQGGGDGGERLPGGPPGEAGTARRSRGGTVGSRTAAAAIRARPPEHPGSAGARRGGAVLAPARAPCRGQGRPLGASVQRTRSSGTRTVAARRSAPAWQWMSWAANPRALGKNRLMAPEFFRPQPRGRLDVQSPEGTAQWPRIEQSSNPLSTAQAAGLLRRNPSGSLPEVHLVGRSPRTETVPSSIPIGAVALGLR